MNIESEVLDSDIQVQIANLDEAPPDEAPPDQVKDLAEKTLQHQRKIDDAKRGLLQFARDLDYATPLGKVPESDAFVDIMYEITQKYRGPQRDKLKLNRERVHVPIQKIMNNYSKNQKTQAEKKKLLKENSLEMPKLFRNKNLH